MIRTDEGALICDLAETYNILDYKSVPGRLLGTLAAGLGEDSRIFRSIAKTEIPLTTLLMARTVDELAAIRWMTAMNKKAKKPESVVKALTEKPKPKVKKELTFRSGRAFDQARAKLLGEQDVK